MNSIVFILNNIGLNHIFFFINTVLSKAFFNQEPTKNSKISIESEKLSTITLMIK
jgi:hypothetical protein